jgi:2-polyprenyl-6-methoxyphenol hydroxylase-like FAD-dependent oxidoreductase
MLNVQILFGHKVSGIEQDESCATVECETSDGPKYFKCKYVVGADGARSTVRKVLGIEFEGYTLDRWIVACNVRFPFRDYGFSRGQFIVHPEHFAMVGKIDPTGLFRVSYNEDGSMTREEAIANAHNKFEKIFPGPKPLKKDAYELVMCSPYRVHQRCSTQFRKGRVLLCGDCAHACNPYGVKKLN